MDPSCAPAGALARRRRQRYDGREGRNRAGCWHSRHDASCGESTGRSGTGLRGRADPRRALGFLLLPLYTRKLTPADYGIVQLTMLVFEVVSLVAGARIASGIFRLYFRCDNERDRQRLLATAFLLVNISYMLSGLVIVVAATPLSIMVLDGEANSTTLRIAGLSFMVQGLIIIPHANFKLQQQPWRIVTTSVGLQVMQAGLNVLFLVDWIRVSEECS